MAYSSANDLKKLNPEDLERIVTELNKKGIYTSIDSQLLDSFFRNWGYMDEGKDSKFLIDKGYDCNGKGADDLAIASFEDDDASWVYGLYSTERFTDKEAKNIMQAYLRESKEK